MSRSDNGFVETYRSVVAAWECDVMGHLTIAYYFDRFGDAAFSLIEQRAPAAAPPAAVWATRRLCVRYQQELRAGDGVAIRSGVIGTEGTAIRIGHELIDTGSGEVATVVEHTLAPRDLPYGALENQRRTLAAAELPWKSQRFDDVAAPTRTDRMIETGRDRIKAWEVDERGELALSGFVHRFAHACLHVCTAIGATPDYMRRERRGFSTFETRLELVAPPPGAGDGVFLRSGLLAAGNSSLRMIHELFLTRGGERLAAFHQFGVHFDMEARRSAPMPSEIKDKTAALLVA
ncbi:MAG TPA: acyl-[acyl-carrier-protein] thioesterase [Stellaceae bacterium]|nr:acyl-[acyl-carrier-protein] thioesterase [Stellaceae bacterium]